MNDDFNRRFTAAQSEFRKANAALLESRWDDRKAALQRFYAAADALTAIGVEMSGGAG